MKFTVEIEDFWLDEDSGSLDEELRHAIKSEVVREIKSSIKEQIEAEIKAVAKEEIAGSLSTEIAMVIRDIVTNGTIKKQSNSEDRITVKELIVGIIEGGRNSWSDPRKELQKYADKHMEKIKSQYDFIFASSIVKKMAEQGMLKDANIDKLLSKEDK